MLADRLREVSERLYSAALAAGTRTPALLAVSKLQPATAIAELSQAGQRLFGENYVQEAMLKQQWLRDAGLDAGIEWHLIGHLQSNKAREAARAFDWVHSVDRRSIVDALARHRPADAPPLNVLIQVNVDDETSKHGAPAGEVASLAATIAAQPTLCLRGLMAIPFPHDDVERRRPAFRAMRALFESLRASHASVDTLSMGMSDDFAVALEEGSTLVRVGTALFGARSQRA